MTDKQLFYRVLPIGTDRFGVWLVDGGGLMQRVVGTANGFNADELREELCDDELSHEQADEMIAAAEAKRPGSD